MESVDILKSINPELSEYFIDSALRFYSEALKRGEPQSYWNELQNASFPGKESIKQNEEEIAGHFIKWHDQRTSNINAASAGQAEGQSFNEALEKEETDQASTLAFQRETAGLFDEE